MKFVLNRLCIISLNKKRFLSFLTQNRPNKQILPK